jgi:Protein of unknown function (DUF4089)
MTASDSTQYLLQMAHELGLSLPQDEMERVKAVFGVLEGAAAQVRDAPLGAETIAAAIFSPVHGPKK